MNIAYVTIGVALTCFILYALDRKSRGEQIDFAIAGKFMVLGGLLGGGITYASSSGDILDGLKNVVPEIPIVQDMFVGAPTF
jgi:hypothetical protein